MQPGMKTCSLPVQDPERLVTISSRELEVVQHAASIAGLVLTMEVIITDFDDKKDRKSATIIIGSLHERHSRQVSVDLEQNGEPGYGDTRYHRTFFLCYSTRMHRS
jgi:hypothetical protein